jgi:hypothetical protein
VLDSRIDFLEQEHMRALFSIPGLSSRSLPAKPSPYERAMLAALFHEKGGASREKIASARWPKDLRTQAFIAKADQTVGQHTVAGWALEIAMESWGEFMGSLESHSAVAQFMDRGLVSLLGRSKNKKFPRRTSAQAAMAWVAPAAPIPIRQYTLAALDLVPKRMAVISVISRELKKYSDAEKIIGTIFREDAGLSLDSAYFSTAATSAAQHGGLLNGVTPLVGYGGGDEAAMKEDLGALMSAVAAGGSNDVVIIGSSARALSFKVKFPQQAAQLQILGSAAVPADRLIAIDPLSLVHGFGNEPSFDSSEETLLHMSDTPLELVDAAAVKADPVMSAFQVGAIALRCELEVAFGKRRTNAVAYVDAVTW